MRALIAILIGSGLLVAAVRRPRLAVLLTFAYLTLMALIRRVLIPVADWTTFDPLLLVGPVVSIVLAIRFVIVAQRPLAPDLLSKLIVVLLALTVLESFNPLGGGAATGLVGLLFVGAPLLWYFVGREVADKRFVSSALGMFVIMALGVAAYGLYQTAVGFPSWDLAWIYITGNNYSALNVNGVIRGFGTFASNSEYGVFLSMAAIVCTAWVIKGRWIALVPIPLLSYAAFVTSSRGVIVFAVLAAVVIVATRYGGPRLALFAPAVAVAVWVAALPLVEPVLSDVASASNPLVAHQIGGLAHPFDPTQSTLGLHYQIVLQGLQTSLQYPLGLGTASTNLAAVKLAALGAGTEFDISNEFVVLGPVGGILFVAVAVTSLVQTARLWLTTRDTVALAIMGGILVAAGQWLNGGYYAVSAIVWFAIGFVSAENASRRLRSHAATSASNQSSVLLTATGLVGPTL